MSSNWIARPKHSQSFVDQGYCIVSLPDEAKLGFLRDALVKGLRSQMKGGEGLDSSSYLNSFHKFVDRSKLNEIRVKVHKEVCATDEFKRAVFECIQGYLNDIIGNEIVMQRQVNFVVHMPKDPTALIYLHTDAWAGCSPYEVILWLPLVDVFGTKSMYLCERPKNEKHLQELKNGLKLGSAADLLKKIRPDIQPLKLKYGEALLFSSTLMHGAEENQTDETRFILNVRFKSLFSPYGTKGLGETFLPVQYSPATEVGLAYESEYGMVKDRE